MIYPCIVLLAASLDLGLNWKKISYFFFQVDGEKFCDH